MTDTTSTAGDEDNEDKMLDYHLPPSCIIDGNLSPTRVPQTQHAQSILVYKHAFNAQVVCDHDTSVHDPSTYRPRYGPARFLPQTVYSHVADLEHQGPRRYIVDMAAGNGVLFVIPEEDDPIAIVNGVQVARFGDYYHVVGVHYNRPRKEMLLVDTPTDTSTVSFRLFCYNAALHTQAHVDGPLRPMPIEQGAHTVQFLDIVDILMLGFIRRMHSDSTQQDGSGDSTRFAAYSLLSYEKLYEFEVPSADAAVQQCPPGIMVNLDNCVQIRDAASGAHIHVCGEDCVGQVWIAKSTAHEYLVNLLTQDLQLVPDPTKGAFTIVQALSSAMLLKQEHGPLEIMPMIGRRNRQGTHEQQNDNQAPGQRWLRATSSHRSITRPAAHYTAIQ